MVPRERRANRLPACEVFLGAGKVIGTGRNKRELQELLSSGADVVIPFMLDAGNPIEARQYEEALIAEFAHGVDVVIDYLWGESAKTIIIAIASTLWKMDVLSGSSTWAEQAARKTSNFPAALRSSTVQLMGSGVRSVPFEKLLEAIRKVFDTVAPARLQIATKTVPFFGDEEACECTGEPRIVVSIP